MIGQFDTIKTMERFKPHAYEGGSGQPAERTDIRKGYEARQISPEEQELLNTPEAQEAVTRVREVLDTLNQDVLFDIFREYYGKAGNNPDSLHLSDVADIDIFYDPDADRSGGHHVFGKPEVNAGLSNILSDDFIINIAIHEYLHEATAAPFTSTHYETDHPNVVAVEDEQMLGVRKFVGEYDYDTETGLGSEPSTWKFNDPINEGLTQLLADDIHSEYNRRVGAGNNSVERQNREATGFSPETYSTEQMNARIYIALLSADTDIPEDVIKDAVTKAYFRNGDIAPEEVGLLLDEDISEPNEHFKNVLKKRLDKKDFLVFAENAAGCLPPDKQEKLMQRCEDLYQQLGASVHAEYRDDS
jgi:hypothetical protein